MWRPSPRAGRRIKIAISLMLVGGLLYFLDTASLRASLKEIKLSYVLLAFAMVVTNRILMPVKWNMLLRARGIHVSNFDAVRVYTMSSFLGLVLPPTVGADSIRSYYLKRAGLRLSDVVASIAIERVFGLLVLLVFTIAGFAILVDLLRDGAIHTMAFAGLLTVISVGALAAVSISFSSRMQTIVGYLVDRIQSSRLSKLARGAEKFLQAYQEHRHKKRILAIFCLLTGLELLLVIVRSYVIALALGVDLSLMIFFAFLPLVTLLNRMPISFDGFGINEALFIYFLGLFGVLPEKAFLIGFVNHIIFLIGIMPGGIFYVMSGSDKPSGSDRPGALHK